MVDFPEPESPVSQSVQPWWPRTFVRSAWVIWLLCQVMLSDLGAGSELGTGCVPWGEVRFLEDMPDL